MPMFVYVSNYCSMAELEAEMDDPSFDLESLSSPQLSSISFALTEKFVESCKAATLKDVMSDCADIMGDAEVSWIDEGWTTYPEGDPRRHSQTWRLLLDGDVFGMMVIQRVQVEE